MENIRFFLLIFISIQFFSTFHFSLRLLTLRRLRIAFLSRRNHFQFFALLFVSNSRSKGKKKKKILIIFGALIAIFIDIRYSQFLLFWNEIKFEFERKIKMKARRRWNGSFLEDSFKRFFRRSPIGNVHLKEEILFGNWKWGNGEIMLP